MHTTRNIRSWVQAVALALLLVGTLLPGGGLPVFTLTAVVLVPILLWLIVTDLRVVHRAVPCVLILAAVVAVPAVLASPTTDYGSTKVTGFLLFTLPTALAVVLIRDRRDITTWAKVWVASGCLLAVVALVGEVDPAGRAIGDGDSNPIWLARAIGSPAVALLWLTYRRALPRVAVVGAVVLLGAGLNATGSRGPVVALAIATLITVTLSSPAARTGRAAAVILSTAAALYLVLAFQLVPATSRLGAVLYDPRGELEASQRIELARPTIELIKAHPGGVGFGSWADHVTILLHRYPHNLFLEVFAEAGWIPGAALLALVAWVMVRLWRASGAEPTAVLCLALLVFETTCVSVSGDLNARTFYFVLTLGYAVSYWTRTAAPPRTTRPAPTTSWPQAQPMVPSGPARR
ncbi:O-antigen ligase [Micromonospora nigra]|uniref:O-antigen ligase n=1 Tax=Micromonospora nigra TaxID=145857 RepID=A0A1C6SPS3_9ACTN|nr:O-antigen ligase family protein [Micromonospora nigra]SCL31510.1 O-antigen ligase [Micromonospora nigra]